MTGLIRPPIPGSIDPPIDTLEECMRRDPKRLYARATSGQIASLTGLGSPYEPPVKPDLFLPTVTMPLDQCVRKTVQYIRSVGALPK